MDSNVAFLVLGLRAEEAALCWTPLRCFGTEGKIQKHRFSAITHFKPDYYDLLVSILQLMNFLWLRDFLLVSLSVGKNVKMLPFCAIFLSLVLIRGNRLQFPELSLHLCLIFIILYCCCVEPKVITVNGIVIRRYWFCTF